MGDQQGRGVPKAYKGRIRERLPWEGASAQDLWSGREKLGQGWAGELAWPPVSVAFHHQT